MENYPWLPLMLQMGDTAFPCGGYTHSLGLEEIVRQGLVHDESSLLGFLRNHILPLIEHVELPLLRECHAAARNGDIATLITLDSLAGALKPARELREASSRMGRRRLDMQLVIGPSDCLLSLRRAVEIHKIACHHVVVFAVALAEAPIHALLASSLHQILAGYCAAALKLIRIGQEASHRVLAACLGESAALLERSMQLPLEQIGWFDPVLDIASMRHEIANERLFIS